jgi:hypothetical protein
LTSEIGIGESILVLALATAAALAALRLAGYITIGSP